MMRKTKHEEKPAGRIAEVSTVRKSSDPGRVLQQAGSSGSVCLSKDFVPLNLLATPKRTAQIIPALADYISVVGLREGDKLPGEKELCTIFGVGRRSLREAMIALQALGLLEARHGSGWYVNRFDPATSLSFLAPVLQNFSNADVEQIMHTRLLIEPEIAKHAAQNFNSDDCAELNRIFEMMKETAFDKTLSEFRPWDRRFHNLLADRCGNELLAILSSILTGVFYSILWISPHGNYERILVQHEKILNAVAAGDSVAAEQATEAHLKLAWTFLKENIHEG